MEKILKNIFIVILTITLTITLIHLYCARQNPGFYGFIGDFFITVVLVVPILVIETELYLGLKYFLLDTNHTATRTFLTCARLLFTLALITTFIVGLLMDTFHLNIIWPLSSLIFVLHFIERLIKEQDHT